MIQKQIENEFEIYLQCNDNGCLHVPWDAAKAVIQGRIIALNAFFKKEKQKRVLDLQEEKKSLEIKHTEQKDTQILI